LFDVGLYVSYVYFVYDIIIIIIIVLPHASRLKVLFLALSVTLFFCLLLKCLWNR